MKKFLILLIFFSGFIFGQTATEDYGICKKIFITWEHTSSHLYDAEKKKLQTSDSKESFTITIDNLDTERPTLYGNSPILGTVKLGYLNSGSGNNFYLAEFTLSQDLVLYVVFPLKRRIILQKQYQYPFGNSIYSGMTSGSYKCVK
ncbi:MAG: hypothetical protein LBQ18_06475 [Campylobacteraceae bacterium]|nr:hypothetical protein [Campylobacteraceae bacterium]